MTLANGALKSPIPGNRTPFVFMPNRSPYSVVSLTKPLRAWAKVA